MHPQVSTCTRNLDDAIEKLSNIGVIRNNSIIISCGTVTTHLNLKTSEGIALIMLLLDSFIFKVKPSYTLYPMLRNSPDKKWSTRFVEILRNYFHSKSEKVKKFSEFSGKY